MNRLFPTGVPVLGKELAGRDKEKKRVKQLLKSGQSVVLYGPRRIGKTSIGLTVLKELKSEGLFTGHADIFESATLSVFSQRIVETTLANKKLAHTIKSLKNGLSAAISKIEIKQVVNQFEWILKFAEPDVKPDDLLPSALDFPEQFSKKYNANMVMFIDEIGDIDKFNGGDFIKLMRSKLQLHTNVTYLFAGSHESVMENIFIKSSGPFYRFAQLSAIDTIEKESFKLFLKRKFQKAGVIVEEPVLHNLLEITGGHPYHTQLLCRELLFYALNHGKSIDKQAVGHALEEAMYLEDLYFSKLWEELGKNSAQVNILQVLVNNKSSLYHKDIKAKINVTRTLNQLIKRGILKKSEKRFYEFTDPLFRKFIERKF